MRVRSNWPLAPSWRLCAEHRPAPTLPIDSRAEASIRAPVEVRLHTSLEIEELERSGFDVGLCTGNGACFVDRYGPFRNPADLIAVPLIERTDPRCPLCFAEAALALQGSALLVPKLYESDLHQDGSSSRAARCSTRNLMVVGPQPRDRGADQLPSVFCAIGCPRRGRPHQTPPTKAGRRRCRTRIARWSDSAPP